MKYHINDAGDPGPCSAKIKCRFGGSKEHYPTPEDAAKAYEEKMAKEIVSTNSKKTSTNTVNVSFENQLPTIETQLNRIQTLALGPKQEKIEDLLHEVTHGRVNDFGRVRKLSAFDAMETLTKVSRLIGSKNPDAKKAIKEIINTIDNSTDVKRNSFYQSSKVLNKTRLPAGATRRKELRSNRKFIELPNGNEIKVHIPLSQRENGVTNFALTDPLGNVIKTSHNIKELF